MATHVGDIHVVTEDWLVRGPAWSLDRPATRQRLRDFQAGAWLPGRGPGSPQPVPAPSERLRVPFSGRGSGRAPLTWGQRDIWATMLRQRNWLPQGGRRPLAPGTRPEDMAAELAYLHSRYPTMRTRLSFNDPLGEPHQWLVSSGETHIAIYDTPTGQSPDVFAAHIEAAYRRRPYDLRREWPIRMALIRTGGTCTHLVVLMHHLALDAGAAAVMLRELATRVSTEPEGMQPLEQAAWQTSDAGRRHNDKTLRYFAQILGAARTGNPAMAGIAEASRGASLGQATTSRPRYCSARLTSPDLAAAVAAVSARSAADDSVVLTALIGIAFARLSGDSRVVVRPRVGNRFRPALNNVVCFLAQSGLLVLDLAGATFDEAVVRARRASMAAMKHGYFDPRGLDALLGGADDAGIAMFFNDRRAATPDLVYATGAAPDPREASVVRGRSRFAWLRNGPEPTEPLAITLDDATDDPKAPVLSLSLHFDTRVIAPHVIERLAWGVERAASEAERDGAAATGL